VQLTARQLCDFELLATGAFSPLNRFLGEADYRGVLRGGRLSDGTLFPIPVTLNVASPEGLVPGGWMALRNAKNNVLATMRIDEVFEVDPEAEAHAVCGTASESHPLVAEMRSWGRFALSGELRVIELPQHADFPDLRCSPAEVRQALEALGRGRVVAFQTRNPMHRGHEEILKRAAVQLEATTLIHPAVGLTKPGDVDYYLRIRTYRALTEHHFEPSRTLLRLVPLAMRMAGPREAVWHAIVRRNYGASHFVVGRDHAGPGKDLAGRPFYAPEAAQELALQHAEELGVGIVAPDEMVYLPEEDRYEEASRTREHRRVFALSGSALRKEYLGGGAEIPEWLARPAVAQVLREAYPPKSRQGFCLWFTGLPSAGKSTIAELVNVTLLERGRQVTLLDGDVVRTHLSKGLGFSREDRDTNILRIGYVASEIVRHHGVVIVAAVSPYRVTRSQVRAMMPEGFVEVFVDTPQTECERRDVKGYYAKARAGELKGFTGVDDPYEEPLNPEVRIGTAEYPTKQENAAAVIRYLEEFGFVARR
jgi:sulfate adenylyltransferase